MVEERRCHEMADPALAQAVSQEVRREILFSGDHGKIPCRSFDESPDSGHNAEIHGCSQLMIAEIMPAQDPARSQLRSKGNQVIEDGIMIMHGVNIDHVEVAVGEMRNDLKRFHPMQYQLAPADKVCKPASDLIVELILHLLRDIRRIVPVMLICVTGPGSIRWSS